MNDIARSAEHYANSMLHRRKEYREHLAKGQKPFVAMSMGTTVNLVLRPGMEHLNDVESTVSIEEIKKKAVFQAVKNKRNLTGLINSMLRENLSG